MLIAEYPAVKSFEELRTQLSGEFYFDQSAEHQAIIRVYATDASVYQEMPFAVAIPRDTDDIKKLINFARLNQLTLIPRAAGTSLAGQVVGKGIVVDISKYLNVVVELNAAEKWVRVQPGVIRDDLNAFLKPYGLMFGPETSTSSRAMIGGMIGNNSCGLHSIIWGATRDNLISVNGVLSDGSEVVFDELNPEEIIKKREQNSFEGRVYNDLIGLIEQEGNQQAIKENFPRKEVKRRNSGYALDSLVDMIGNQKLNLSALVAGSEGTLCFVTEAKLKLIDLPPSEVGMVAVHCASIHEALLANLIALKNNCAASELVDHVILEQALNNSGQIANRFFITGEPQAILMVEFFNHSQDDLLKQCNLLIAELSRSGLGYAYPIILGDDTKRAWDIRKAGLGLLRNLKGDTQPVNLIEDCAVAVDDLPFYISDLEILLKEKGVAYSMYAHAGAGELHVEPMINLKTTEGKKLFKDILTETAVLVKKYRGSLSGEHGDGRLRGEFISAVMGEEVYELFKIVKSIFDPQHIFNKGKITNTPSMLDNLRYQPTDSIEHIETMLDFSEQEGILRLTEKCSGSGDCRKTHITGGTMCPSYMVTRNEKDTTRARANILRQYLSAEPESFGQGKMAEMVKDVLDLCIACKGCKMECPSSVDMTKLRAEFLYQYQQKHGVSFRSKVISNFSAQMKWASLTPSLYNAVVKSKFIRQAINHVLGFHPDRSLPLIGRQTLKAWYKNREINKSIAFKRSIYLFCDEFTNYTDVIVGQKAILLLEQLGYKVIIPDHVDSGRSQLSKGILDKAKVCAETNVKLLSGIVDSTTPLIGLEPSAILSFRDEYPDLVDASLKQQAKQLSLNVFLFEEWFHAEIQKGNITSNSFTTDSGRIVLHGHCHQKAWSSMQMAVDILSLPVNYQVDLIPSGCCGMAGSFGYEKEHYELSMKIGELVLFPAIRKQDKNTCIAAAGTSCRHQIKDGTGKVAQHPAEILFKLLNQNTHSL